LLTQLWPWPVDVVLISIDVVMVSPLHFELQFEPIGLGVGVPDALAPRLTCADASVVSEDVQMRSDSRPGVGTGC
jgi:hypothetical protein